MASSGRSASARSDLGLVFLIAAQFDDTSFLFCLNFLHRAGGQAKVLSSGYNRGLEGFRRIYCEHHSCYALRLVNEEN